jgi:hypothetical protein
VRASGAHLPSPLHGCVKVEVCLMIFPDHFTDTETEGSEGEMTAKEAAQLGPEDIHLPSVPHPTPSLKQMQAACLFPRALPKPSGLVESGCPRLSPQISCHDHSSLCLEVTESQAFLHRDFLSWFCPQACFCFLGPSGPAPANSSMVHLQT